MRTNVSLSELHDRALAILRNVGAILDCVCMDGELHYCGTMKKPEGTDFRYKMHTDFPPTVGYINYHTDGVWTNVSMLEKTELAKVTDAERKAFKARMERERAAAQAAKEQKHKEAAWSAERILRNDTVPCRGSNNYLVQKEVIECAGLRELTTPQDIGGEHFPVGSLVVPLRKIGTGAVVGLQLINDAGKKRFIAGMDKTGAGFIVGWREDEKLLIAEGLATALSLWLATGFAVVVALSAGNLMSVGKALRSLYPDREICFCADNDAERRNPYTGELENIGLIKAMAAAAAIGASYCYPPSESGESVDFNDYYIKKETF